MLSSGTPPLLTTEEAALRVLLSVFLGAVVGLERELTQKSAGLRTHILVCMGACVFTIISVADLILEAPANGNVVFNRDPHRIAAQIVTGIGFIGGGAVLRHGGAVYGLTTAASLWMMASIGMLCGSGHSRLSIITTLITFLILFTVGNVERTYFGKHMKAFNRLRLVVHVHAAQVDAVQTWVEKSLSREILEQRTQTNTQTEETILSYVLNIAGSKVDVGNLTQRLNRVPGVQSSEFRVYEDTTRE